LLNHLRSQHKDQYEEYLKLKTPGTKRPSPDDEREEGRKKQAKLEECFANTDKDLNAAIDNAIVDFLADTGTAFKVVGEESFIKLMKVANKNIKLKHRTTYSRLVKVKANEIRKNIHEIITAVKGDLTAVGFTTDMWTSCSGQPFMSLTCHFIDKDWELHR